MEAPTDMTFRLNDGPVVYRNGNDIDTWLEQLTKAVLSVVRFKVKPYISSKIIIAEGYNDYEINLLSVNTRTWEQINKTKTLCKDRVTYHAQRYDRKQNR